VPIEEPAGAAVPDAMPDAVATAVEEPAQSDNGDPRDRLAVEGDAVVLQS
jgi:hypothetical protein